MEKGTDTLAIKSLQSIRQHPI